MVLLLALLKGMLILSIYFFIFIFYPAKRTYIKYTTKNIFYKINSLLFYEKLKITTTIFIFSQKPLINTHTISIKPSITCFFADRNQHRVKIIIITNLNYTTAKTSNIIMQTFQTTNLNTSHKKRYS